MSSEIRIAITYVLTLVCATAGAFILGLFLSWTPTPEGYSYEYRCYVYPQYEVCVLRDAEFVEEAKGLAGFQWGIWRGWISGTYVSVQGDISAEDAEIVIKEL